MNSRWLRALLLGALVCAAACESAPRDPVVDAGQALSDAALTAHVKAALLADQALGALPIKVEAKAGVVRLSGSPLKQLEAAARIAKDVPGVRSVDVSEK